MQQAARRKAKAAVVANPMRKGSGKKQRQAPKRHEKADTIVALADSGASNAAISAETGVSQRQVRHVVEEETLAGKLLRLIRTRFLLRRSRS